MNIDLNDFYCYRLSVNSKISLIIPVFNESNEVTNFFDQLNKCDFNIINEIIFVNDCSTDNSLIKIEEAIINLKKNLLLLIFHY